MRAQAGLISALLLVASCTAPAGGPTQAPAMVAPSATVLPSGTAPAATSPAPAATAALPADWPTYHGDAARTGASSEVAGFTTVERAWRSDPLDGDVYAAPIVAGGTAVVVTERNTMYAFDARTGIPRWRTTFGQPVDASTLPCGNIRPVSGITGTPVADPRSGLVYAVAFESQPSLHHELYAVDLATGAVRFHRAVDAPGADPRVHQQRAALGLAGGTVYVAYGGLLGDCGDYKGTVVGVPADGGSGMVAYRLPAGREGGIWAPSGMAIDAAGKVYVATGNTDTTGTFDQANSVLRLSARLELEDHWAPADWLALSRSDTDIGSVGPTLLADGLLAIGGKNGYLYLLRASALGRIGGELAKVKACAGVYGGFAYAAGVLYAPCTDGLVAVKVEPARGSDALTVLWRGQRFDAGSPIVAHGAVWVADRNAGILYALDPASGQARSQQGLGRMQRFTTPAAWGDLILVAADGRLLALRLR